MGEKKKRHDYNYYRQYSNFFFYRLFSSYIAAGLCTQQQAADYFKISPSTLSAKYNLWRDKGKTRIGTCDRRGMKRKLTATEETAVKAKMEDRIHSHIHKTQNKHVPAIVASVNPAVESFSVSSVSRLKKRVKITSRTTPVAAKRFSKRLTEEEKERRLNILIDDVCHYLEDVDEAVKKHGPDNVYQMDEKPLSGAPSRVSSFQRMGEKTEKIHSHGSPDRIMTAACTVTAFGRKIPILFLKKGESKTCKSFKALKNNISLFSNELDLTRKGWMNEYSMLKYLELLSANIPHRPCTLILDHYGSHKKDSVRKFAADLKIDLILVPRTLTGELQPLDVGVFGCLQAMTDADWDTDDTALDYMNCFQRAFQEIAASTIQKAFADALDIPLRDLQVRSPSPAAQAMNSINSSFQHALNDLQSRGAV